MVPESVAKMEGSSSPVAGTSSGVEVSGVLVFSCVVNLLHFFLFFLACSVDMAGSLRTTFLTAVEVLVGRSFVDVSRFVSTGPLGRVLAVISG